MIKELFKHILRGFTSIVVSYVLTVFLVMIAQLIMTQMLGINEISVKVYYNIAGIGSCIICFLWCMCPLMFDWEWFYGEVYLKRKKSKIYPHIISLLLLLIVVLLIGAVGAFMGYNAIDRLDKLVKESEDWLFLVIAFPSVAGSQLMLFIVMAIYYLSHMCWRCGRVFSMMETTGKEFGKYDEYGYEASTKYEGAGKIVTRGKVTVTHNSKASVVCECLACGKKTSYIRLFKRKD